MISKFSRKDESGLPAKGKKKKREGGESFGLRLKAGKESVLPARSICSWWKASPSAKKKEREPFCLRAAIGMRLEVAACERADGKVRSKTKLENNWGGKKKEKEEFLVLGALAMASGETHRTAAILDAHRVVHAAGVSWNAALQAIEKKGKRLREPDTYAR